MSKLEIQLICEYNDMRTIFVLITLLSEKKSFLTSVPVEGPFRQIYICPCCMDTHCAKKIDVATREALKSGETLEVQWPYYWDTLGCYNGLTPSLYSKDDSDMLEEVLKSPEFQEKISKLTEEIREKKYAGEVRSLIKRGRYHDAESLCTLRDIDFKSFAKK